MRISRSYLVLVILWLICNSHRAVAQTTAPAEPAWSVQSDVWYSLQLDHLQVGWMRIVRESDGSRLRTVNEISLAHQQAGVNLVTETFVQWLESDAGQPLRLELFRRNAETLRGPDWLFASSAWERTRNGDSDNGLTLRRAWDFRNDSATKTVRRDDGELIQLKIPFPDGRWLPPAAQQRKLQERIADGSATYQFVSLNPGDELHMTEITSTRIGSSHFPWKGELRPTIVWQTKAEGNSTSTLSHYASDGTLMYSVANLAMSILETRMCSKEEALVPANRPVLQIPVPASAKVKLDRNLTARTRAVYEISSPDRRLPMIPTVGCQSVEMAGDGKRAVITVDQERRATASVPEIEESKLRDNAEALVLIDPIASNLASRAMKQTEGVSPLELALSSCNVVGAHFAGVESDTASDGSAESSTLIAVLGIHRIQARRVSGLAFSGVTNAVFVWRNWAQALMDGKWVDLDALDPKNSAPNHIVFGVAGPGIALSNPDPLGISSQISSYSLKVVSED